MKTLSNLLDNDDSLDINSTYPSLLVRKGMFILFIFFALLFLALSFIPYPEKETIKTSLVTSLMVYPTYDRKLSIDSILIADNQEVHEGEVLVRLKNTENGKRTVLEAPFDGVFLYSGSKSTGYSFLLLDIKALSNSFRVEVDSMLMPSKAPLKRTQLIFSENDIIIDVKVKSITNIPNSNKVSIGFNISDVGKQMIVNSFKKQKAPFKNCQLIIFSNENSVLGKLVGVLNKKINI
jgi:hypothetical protein